MSAFGGRLRALLAAIVGLAAAAAAQVPPPANTQPLPPGFGRFGPTYEQQPPTPAPAANSGAPLFGQSWPHIGPDPAPRAIGPGRCPPGYIEPSSTPHQAHLVICVVQQPTLAVSFGRANSGQSYPNTGNAGQAPGQPLSSLPANQERSVVNRCAGRPIGTYACGRGGTECCGPNQSNMCFAGAFACAPTGMGTGPKTACCISK
jgi:hypothetical protein